ncbi:MAG: MBL fold metallo-hydrolase [Dehalococcoidia bacterium]|nr:MBL fold metallo-hydrolase [Dehalococcoidia bacterium]
MGDVRRIAMAYNNVYVSEGPGGRVLVDTGPDYRGARDVLLAEVPELPVVVVATHGHHDHAGLGHWWQSRGVQVAIGAADGDTARHPHYSDQAELDAMLAWVAQLGAPAEVAAEAAAGLRRRRESAQAARWSGDYPPPGSSPSWPTGLRYEPFAPDIELADGDRAAHLDVLVCPGHTPGNAVLVDRERGWLFSGDQLLPDITPTPAIQFTRAGEGGYVRFRSLPAFTASLRRLAGLPLARCYPGHGEPFEDARGTIAANLAAIEARDERVHAELASSGELTVYELAARLYPRAVQRRFWQIIATVQGHLDTLEATARCSTNGDRYWTS